MLHNLKQIRGYKLAASDGAIGHVKDFYFDDQSWAIRYLVADTGNWLAGRQVLLSPFSFGPLDHEGKVMGVNLTRNQIENSPSIATDRPVSRQYEENYYNYYGWPAYWTGGGIWGTLDDPAFAPSPRSYAFQSHQYPQWDDAHLRSAHAVAGYAIQAIDGTLGTVSGFLVDEKNWVIRELTVETGHWYSGKEILIAPQRIERISYEESKVFVTLTKGNLERTGEQQPATLST